MSNHSRPKHRLFSFSKVTFLTRNTTDHHHFNVTAPQSNRSHHKHSSKFVAGKAVELMVKGLSLSAHDIELLGVDMASGRSLCAIYRLSWRTAGASER